MDTSKNKTLSEQGIAPGAGVDNASDTVTLTLLPDTFRNALFEQNLAYFQQHQPDLFSAISKHRCQDYRLCANPDGSPNIVYVPDNSAVYAASTIEGIMSPIQKVIDKLFCWTHLSPGIMGTLDAAWVESNPIQAKMFKRLYDSSIFKEMQISTENLAPLECYKNDYLAMVRVYGIGLGFHLTELIKQKKISYMLVYEPHFDLFYTSLFTIPWALIFKYFEFNNKGLHLALGTNAEQAIASHHAFMGSRLTPVTSLFYRFNHFDNSLAIDEMIRNESQKDSVQRQQLDSGWYEDQRIGFYFAARNIRKNNKFFTGKKIKQFFCAFIVGSGPSLDGAIEYLKEHQHDAIVIACGSAIGPLIKAGIIPDYEVVQERNWHTAKVEQEQDAGILKQISLLKLNVVSTQIDHFYKEVLIFQKLNDPGSTLMDERYAVTGEVNPTVTNAGIAMAADLGVNKVYLFGVDYGAPEGASRMHANNTLYDDMDDGLSNASPFKLPGNLGAVICSDGILVWSHDTTEMRLRNHLDIQWFNVGEGAKIKGTIPIEVARLPKRFTKSTDKHRLRQKISACFDNHYQADAVIERLKTYYMAQVDDYFDALLGFTQATPQTREEIVGTLTLMYKAIGVGHNQSHFLPATLLSQGLRLFVTNVYIQNGLQRDEVSAARSFETAQQVLIEHIKDIHGDLREILAVIDNDDEMDLYRKTLSIPRNVH